MVMENILNQIKEIERHTICLYGEHCGTCLPIGSGILIKFDERFYIVSAHHVFDREEELLQIENDPDEYGIDHDDTDSVFVRVEEYGRIEFYRINDHMTGMVFTAYPDDKSQPIINDDTEFAVCYMTNAMVRCIIEAGKDFLEVDCETEDDISHEDTIIISGFPRYAQPNNIGKLRSFQCDIYDSERLDESCLLRVAFDNMNAFNCEQLTKIHIPGIDGMSGGGIWKCADDKIIPIGIILKQDPNKHYVEGLKINQILSHIKTRLNDLNY